MKRYSCSKCPASCCSYPEIEVTPRDVERLAKHFGLAYRDAEARFTKEGGDARIMRHRKDSVFESVCLLLDQETRRCTAYEARPGPCRGYPYGARCGYYEFLRFERSHQDDKTFIALT